MVARSRELDESVSQQEEYMGDLRHMIALLSIDKQHEAAQQARLSEAVLYNILSS